MKSVLLGLAAATALATTASATTAVFDFQNPGPNASAGTVHTYTNNGLSITASGFVSNGGAATTLFDKSGGGDENGLGLTDDPSGDNEITGTNFVQIDVSAIPGFLTDAFSFQMGSSTGGEEWKVFGSNIADSFSGAALVTGTDELPHSLTSGFKYYDFETPGTLCNGGLSVDFCGSGNTLIHTFTAVTAVPEPATWAMMLIGVGGLGATLRLSRKSAGAIALA
jgi:hypothetical protein